MQHRQVRIALFVTLAAMGCTNGRTKSATETPEGGVVVLDGRDGQSRGPCRRPDEASLGTGRKRAAGAFAAGRHREAVAAFEAESKAHPEDLASQALLVASRQRQSAAADRTGPALDNLPLMRLFPPRDGYRLEKPIEGVGSSQPVKLARVSETPNLITDDDVWIKKHGLTDAELSEMRVRTESLPDSAPRSLRGARALGMFAHPDHTIISYGPTLAVLGPSSAQLFDVTGFAEITDARVVNQALVLSTWRNGYSKDVGGKTGYIAAYSIRDGSLLWQSEPLVTSMGGFVVTGEHIVSGYGFTAEPDFVFLLSLANGKTLQKEPLRSGPSVIVQRGDRILLRTYDSDAEFRLTPAPGAAPAAGLPQRAADAPADAETSARLCQVERAIVAIDRRDEPELAVAIKELRREQADKEIIASLEGVQRFLLQQKSATPGIDLWGRRPTKLATPPWSPERRRAVGNPVTMRPRLREISSASASAVRHMQPLGGGPFVPGRPSFLAPVLKGKLPVGVRGDIPSSYGLEDLYAIIPDQEDRWILIYGGRYLAVVRGSTTEGLFDFESYRHPPNVDPTSAQFAVADVTYALVREGVLFVANGGGSYAKEMGGKKGFVTALNLSSGELLWRSSPLVHGGGPFAFWRDFLVTGYGFTAEPDFVFLLRRDTGEVATKAPLKSAPDDLILTGDRLRVEAYEHVHELELSPQ